MQVIELLKKLAEICKGDVDGHEFHGNQYVSASDAHEALTTGGYSKLGEKGKEGTPFHVSVYTHKTKPAMWVKPHPAGKGGVEVHSNNKKMVSAGDLLKQLNAIL